MSISGWELYRITGDFVTADIVVWRRYKRRAPGIVEALLDGNPQLARIHRYTPFIPAGTYVRIPIDPDLILGKPPRSPYSNVWTDARGYQN